MKIFEILEELELHKIPPSSYSIGKVTEESLCLINKNGNFEIFYYERGIKTGLINFSKEEEACNYFIEKLKSWFNK